MILLNHRTNLLNIPRQNHRRRNFSAGLFAMAVLAMVCLIVLPVTTLYAKALPIEAFEGTWEGAEGYPEDYYFNMTFGFIDDSTMYMDFYEEFMGGAGTNRWTGPYTFDESTGVLDATLSTTFQIGSHGNTHEETSSLRIQLTELNELIRYDDDGTPRTYKRISEPPVLPEEEEEEESEEENPEEETEEESSEEEAEEEAEEDTEEESEEEDLEEEETEEDTEDVTEKDVEEAFNDDDLLKWLLGTDDEHLNEMKTIAESAGTTLGAIVISLLGVGVAGGAGTTPGGMAGGGAGTSGTGMTPHGTKPFSVENTQEWKDYQNDIARQAAEINRSMNEYQQELERQWEEAGVGVYDQQRYQDMMAERENQAWIEEQRRINSGLSREAVEWSREKAAMERAFKVEDQRNKLFYKKGIYDGNYKEYKKQWIQERQQEAQTQAWAEERAAYFDAATQTAEEIKSAADVAIDVMAELEPSGVGKQIKNGYKILAETASQTGEVMAGNQSVSQAISKTLVNSTVEYIKDNVNSTEAKLLSNVSGDGLKGYLNARIEGKSHAESLKEGSKSAKQGFVNFAVDYGVGKGMDGLTGGVKIKDKQVYNGLYKNNKITGDGATQWAKNMSKCGFTDGVIKNDKIKDATGAYISDTIKGWLSD